MEPSKVLDAAFQLLLQTIELNSDKESADLKKLLERNYENFLKGLEVFGLPNSASLQKVKPSAGSECLEVDGKPLKNDEKLFEFLKRFSSRVCLDEWQCYELIVKYFKFGAQDTRPPFKYDDELLEHLVFFYYEERLCLMRCIGALFRVAGCDLDANEGSVGRFLKKLLDSGLVENLLKSYKKVSEDKIPCYQGKNAIISKLQASQWLVQNYKEQGEILECLFLAYYDSVSCSPDSLLQLCTMFKENDFSKRKVDEELSTYNLRGVVEKAGMLQILIVVECFRLEELEEEEVCSKDHVFYSRDIMRKLDNFFADLGTARCHGPLLLMWLTMRTKAATERPFENEENIEVTNKLRCSIVRLKPIDYLSALLCSEAMENSRNDNMTAYKSVLKGFLNLLLSFWEVSTLDVGSLVKLSCVIHEGQPDLCLQLWRTEIGNEKLNVLLTMSRINFPLNFIPFTSLMTAISSSRECLEDVFGYLRVIPTLTSLLPEEATNFSSRGTGRSGFNSSWNTNCVECVKDTEDVMIWEVTHDYYIVPGLKLVPGTLGKAILSSKSFPLSIQWKHSYSFWHLAFLFIDFFIGGQGPQDPQVVNCYAKSFGLLGTGKGEYIMDSVEAILKLVYELLKADIYSAEVIETNFMDYARYVLGDRIMSSQVGGSYGNPSTPTFLDKLFHILQRCSIGSAIASKVTTVCLQCINGFAFTYPRESWTLLQQSSVMPHTSATLGNCIGFNTRNNSVNGNIRNILYDVECPNGEYPVTLAILDLLNTLLKQSQADITSSNSAAWRQFQTCELLDIISYVQNDIFTGYSGWRYRRIMEKFNIGLRTLNIFLDIVNDVPLSLVGRNCSKSMKKQVIDSFLRDISLQNSLIDIIALGSEAVRVQYATQKFEEGNTVDSLIVAAFRLLNVLLDSRASYLTYCSSSGVKYEMTSLELTLLSRTMERDHSKHLVGVIASYVSHPYHADTSTLAVRTLRYISLLSSYVEGRPPSLLGYFGGYAEGLRNAFVSKLSFSDSGVELRIEILKFVTSIIESQSGLVSLFLDLASISTTTSKDKSDSIGENSIIHFVLKTISASETYFESKPRLFAHVLTFLLTLWEGASEHHGVLHILRNKQDFWTDLMKPVFSKKLTDFSPGFSAADSENLLEYNYQALCVSSILRIVSLEIYFVPSQNESVKNEKAGLNSCLDSPLVAAVGRIFKEQRFFEWLKSSGGDNKWARTSSVMNRILEKNGKLFNNFSLEDFRHSFSELEYGQNYIYDTSLLLKKMRLEENVELNFSDFDFENIHWESNRNEQEELELNSFVALIEYANNLWSFADTYLVLLRSWRMFIEVGCIRQREVFKSIFSESPDGNPYKYSLETLLNVASWISDFVLEGKEQDAVFGDDSDLSRIANGATDLSDYSSLISFSSGRCYIVLLVCKELCDLLLALTEKALSALSAEKDSFPVKDCVQLLTSVLEIFHSVEETASLCGPLKLSLLSSVCIVLEYIERFRENSSDPEVSSGLYKCANDLMPTLSSLLFSTMTVSPPGQASDKMDVNSSSNRTCIMCITIFGQLLKIGPRPREWLPSLFLQKSLFSLLFEQLVELILELKNPKFCESILLLLLSLSQIPEAAEAMARNGILHYLSKCCNSKQILGYNGVSLLDFYDGTGGRNIWHSCWCLIISIFTFCLRSLRSQDHFVEQCLDFVSVHREKLFRCVSLVVRRTEMKLSLAYLEEIDRVSSLFYELGQVYRRWKFKFPIVTKEVQEMSCFACHKFVYILSRPSQLERAFVPHSRWEKEMSKGGIKGSIYSAHMESRMHSTIRNCLANFRLTSPNIIKLALSSAAVDVAAVDILFSPHLHFNAANDLPSLGTLISILNLYLNFLKAKSSEKTHSPINSCSRNVLRIPEPAEVPELNALVVIENALSVLLSYYGIYMSSFALQTSAKEELRNDLGRELVSFFFLFILILLQSQVF